MSLKEKLAEKTLGLGEGLSARQLRQQTSGAPRTAPGQMLAFREHLQDSSEQIADLRARLQQYAGSVPAKRIEPTRIAPSKWSNRHEDSLSSPAFAELKKEIESASGNVQPVLVRSLGDEKFEIVFGHRRVRACQELGLPVLAVIVDVSDEELFVAMDRENRSRQNLSPYEQGEMYRRALDAGLFPSLRQLASRLNVDPGNASKAISIARLPDVVQKVFPSPTAIQYRAGQLLSEAIQEDSEKVLQRAQRVIDSGVRPTSAMEALDLLLGRKSVRPKNESIMIGGKRIGAWSVSASGDIAMTLKAGSASPEILKRAKEAFEAALRAA